MGGLLVGEGKCSEGTDAEGEVSAPHGSSQ